MIICYNKCKAFLIELAYLLGVRLALEMIKQYYSIRFIVKKCNYMKGNREIISNYALL